MHVGSWKAWKATLGRHNRSSVRSIAGLPNLTGSWFAGKFTFRFLSPMGAVVPGWKILQRWLAMWYKDWILKPINGEPQSPKVGEDLRDSWCVWNVNWALRLHLANAFDGAFPLQSSTAYLATLGHVGTVQPLDPGSPCSNRDQKRCDHWPAMPRVRHPHGPLQRWRLAVEAFTKWICLKLGCPFCPMVYIDTFRHPCFNGHMVGVATGHASRNLADRRPFKGERDPNSAWPGQKIISHFCRIWYDLDIMGMGEASISLPA